jgi:hypothetical protein
MAKEMNLVIPTLTLLMGVVLGYLLSVGYGRRIRREGFASSSNPECGGCGKTYPCPCPNPRPICPPCPPCQEPDLSKYVLKATVPPCPPMPDLSKYMLKTECPPVPDLSQYVLKSSVPKPQPVILDCSKCNKPKGECPPCPRPRCPEVQCPPPTKCPAPAPCPRQICPPTVVKCKAEDAPIQQVRPYLAPLSVTGFGMG